MRIAVIGATGQLGSDLVKVLGKKAIPLTHADIEVKDVSSCLKALEKHRPDIVVNCAAYVRVDDAEDFPDEAFAVNSIGARNVAIACEKINAVNAYISTDYVFDGNKKKPYIETDHSNPVNVYGLSKYAGEIFTKNYSSKYYIFRLASLYGAKGARGKGGNFVETMIQKASNNEEIKVVDDMTMSPTYTRDAAKMINKIIENRIQSGLYHIANNGSCSWFDFAKNIFGFLNLKPNFKPIKSKELTYKARRPVFSALESEKLVSQSLRMPEWKDALKRYLIEKKYL